LVPNHFRRNRYRFIGIKSDGGGRWPEEVIH